MRAVNTPLLQANCYIMACIQTVAYTKINLITLNKQLMLNKLHKSVSSVGIF